MGILAVFFVQSYVSSIEDGARKKFGAEVLVITAKRDIKEMDTIEETMLELKPIPKTFLEPAAMAYTKNENQDAVMARIKELAGSVAIVPIKEGEQITMNKLTEPSIRTGLSPQITPGRRAVTLPVSEISGVAKLVKPGDRVDITAIIEVQANARNNPLATKIAKTVLQDVVVLAVGKHVTNNAPRLLEPDPNSPKLPPKIRNLATNDQFTSVSVEVEPAQAQMLTLLTTGGGQVVLTLRNNDDTERVNMSGVTMGDLLGNDAARVLPPVARSPSGGK
jgi:pilus assembly protein CpaB